MPRTLLLSTDSTGNLVALRHDGLPLLQLRGLAPERAIAALQLLLLEARQERTLRTADARAVLGQQELHHIVNHEQAKRHVDTCPFCKARAAERAARKPRRVRAHELPADAFDEEPAI